MSAGELHEAAEAAGPDRCENCRYWSQPAALTQEQIDRAANRGFRCAGRCERFPAKVLKYAREWCGEYKRGTKAEI